VEQRLRHAADAERRDDDAGDAAAKVRHPTRPSTLARSRVGAERHPPPRILPACVG